MFWKILDVFSVLQAGFFTALSAYSLGANIPPTLPEPFNHGNMLLLELAIILIGTLKIAMWDRE